MPSVRKGTWLLRWAPLRRNTPKPKTGAPVFLRLGEIFQDSLGQALQHVNFDGVGDVPRKSVGGSYVGTIPGNATSRTDFSHRSEQPFYFGQDQEYFPKNAFLMRLILCAE